MGSLTSRPELPQVRQQPVFIAMPSSPVQTVAPPPAVSEAPAAPNPETSATGSNSNSTAPAEGTGNEEAQRLAREDNLLRRSRGRLGTVLTGFGGLLSDTVRGAARKTLLGE